MRRRHRLRKLSTSYLRFKKQLTALHQGRLQTVRFLAQQARGELAIKNCGQLILFLPIN